MKEKRADVSQKYYVNIIANGVSHEQSITDADDIEILNGILNKIKRNAESSVAGYAAANQPHESIEDKIVNEIKRSCTVREQATDMDIAYGICIRIVQKHFKAAAAKDGQAEVKL